MTENSASFTGSGTKDDPLTFDAMRPTAPDPAHVAVGGLAKTARDHAAAFSSASAGLSADLREIVSAASSAITGTLSTAYDARVRADDFMADVKMYPEGRKVLAGEAIKAASDKVAESFAQADAQLEVASALTYEAARPKVATDAAMTARTDLAMITQRHMGNAGALIDAVRSLAQRSDSVGALVADVSYLGDFLSANGVDDETREAALTLVRSEVVKAAAQSGDQDRAAAGKANMALVELRKARIAAMSFTRHILNH
ncbi:hypothetical protein AB0G86_33325 [Streptomyces scabiei]|uniref:hypothetical protein n=1 Tax=Streptomyces scabiei TaxID=1930 RepID=UPI0033C65165